MNKRVDFARKIGLLWAGLVLGGTFIAAPAKFQAPTLSLPTALEIGRITFFCTGVAEFVLCFAYVFMLAKEKGQGWRWLAFWLPIAALIIQRAAIMPLLDARTLQVMKGENVPGSGLHVVYVVFEVVKFAALLWIGFLSQPKTEEEN